MSINVVAGPSSTDSEVLGVPFFEGGQVAIAGLPVPDAAALGRRGFEGKSGQVSAFDIDGRTVVALGLGNAEELTLDGLRRAAATFVKSASSVARAELALTAVEVSGTDGKSKAQAVAEGVLLASYRYGEFKSKADDRKLSSVTLVDADPAGVERGDTISEAVKLARDLANTPPIAMNPTILADIATRVAGEVGLGVTVWDEHKIEEEKLGGLRGVSLGSDQPPRLVQLTYEPEGATGTIVLVGKGITFDSGGLSLKPPDGMVTMKTDMSGAANVLAAMSVLPKLAPKVRVVGIALITENMPGPSAIKPGDVLRARNGKTIEVLNTDAEGRLVLADGLVLAGEQSPDAVVDIATLTGACVIALGGDVAGLFGNNDSFSAQVKAAAKAVDENVWELPMHGKYRKLLESEVADLKNVGPKGTAGAITASLFLKEFIGDIPWVHLDIAGPSRAEADDSYITRGSTGFAVRTLISLVENFTKP